MTIDAIKEEISQLSDADRKQISEWLDDLDESIWDREIETDLSPGGRGRHLVEAAQHEIATGQATSLAQGLRQRRNPRSMEP